MAEKNESMFIMFSIAHFSAIFILILSLILLYIFKKKIRKECKKLVLVERIFSLTLLLIEILYHIWLIRAGRWSLADSLPLELCSISLISAIFLLWTENKHIYDFVFYAGIGGALQAIATPV